MAIFGSARDNSLFRKMNRELLGNIISQQCAFYKFAIDKTITNMYGEASGGKFYKEPVLLNCLIEREDQQQPTSELGVDSTWNITFSLLRDDLVDANILPEVGDIIMYLESYYEIDNINKNQFHVGKDPDYPNSPNPLNPNLEQFGYNVSVICKTHMVPSDRVNIIKSRL